MLIVAAAKTRDTGRDRAIALENRRKKQTPDLHMDSIKSGCTLERLHHVIRMEINVHVIQVGKQHGVCNKYSLYTPYSIHSISRFSGHVPRRANVKSDGEVSERHIRGRARADGGGCARTLPRAATRL